MRHPADNLRSLRRSHTFTTKLFPLFLLILLSLSLAPASLAQDEFSVNALPDIQRMQVLADACADLELNTLCYGGGSVQVTTDGTTTTLSEVGARLPLAGVQRIETTVDEAACTWGGVVLKLQGTAGASQPGMTYVALGNVVLENATAPENFFAPATPQQVSVNTDNLNFRAAPSMEAEVIGQFDTGALLNADALSADGAWLRVESEGVTGWVAREFTQSETDLNTLPALNESAKGWMQDFRLHTAPSACPATLPSLLVIQTPGHDRVPLNVNGMEISVGSTIAFNTLSDNALGGPDTVDPSETELGGPDTVDPSEAELGGPDTVDPSDPSLGGPDTAPVTQMVVLDGSLMLPGLEASGETHAYADEAGEIVGYGLTLSSDDDNAEAFVVPEGTGILLKPPGEQQPDGPIIGAIISQIAALHALIAQQLATALEDQAELKATPERIDIEGTEQAETTIDLADTLAGTPAAESAQLNTTEFALNQGDDSAPSFDLVLQLPQGVVFAEALGPLQLLGGVLPEDDDPIKLDFPGYFDDWLNTNINEPEDDCDDFQGISPHSGTIVLPPDSTLSFSFPIESDLMETWEFIGGIIEGNGVMAYTKFHLARSTGAELKAQETQFYDLAVTNPLTYSDAQGIVHLDYNFYQMQGLGLITPGQTSGTLVWWAENKIGYWGFDSKGAETLEEFLEAIANGEIDPTELVYSEYTCITDLYTLNWTDSETVEQADDIIDPVLSPDDDSIGDTIPDIDVDVQPTPTFNLPTPQILPIEPITPTPPPRDSDGDGVPDDQDRCPTERGVVENAGCPLPPPSDRDGDGVPDDQDRCPAERGVPENNGCPLRRAGS
jgi:hypothetical protein